MKKIIITVEDEDQINQITEVLQEAENNGDLNFCFNVQLEDCELTPKSPRHWSNVFGLNELGICYSRETVEKKYRQLRHSYNGVNLNRDKLKELDQAWEQYNK